MSFEMDFETLFSGLEFCTPLRWQRIVWRSIKRKLPSYQNGLRNQVWWFDSICSPEECLQGPPK